ncbi:MAG: hypothetical protein RMJ98_17720 [Myxococcales bacterium]|nr:hypothetical protein [Polyangiaceae bacterium]MDW8251135.1 hypothetical protein [Myxococcales bacterium]
MQPSSLPVPPAVPVHPAVPTSPLNCPSSAECAVPQPLLGALVWAIWVLAFLAPVIAWGLASLAVGPGGKPRRGRGASVLGPAVLVTAGVLFLFRIVTILPDRFQPLPIDLSGGPLVWLDLLGLTSPGHATTATRCCTRPLGTAPEAMALLAALTGYVLVLVALVLGSRRRGEEITQAFRIPFGEQGSLVLLAGGVLMVLGVRRPVEEAGRSVVLLDALGFAPVACGALAIWMRARYEPEVALEPAVQPTIQIPQASPDVLSTWKQIGAISPEGAPLFATPGGISPGRVEGVSAGCWRLSGALGPPPAALDEVARLFQAPFQGFLVGDLPDPTERIFLSAVVLRAALLEGIPVLVITEGMRRDVDGTLHAELRDAVDEAVRASGMWSCGPLVVGERELREAIAGKRFPAAAFLDVGELSALGIRTLGRAEEGAQWARQVGLVILSKLDRGSGLTVTHRMYTLRRLGLVLRAAGARWSVLATGFGGVATRSLLEQTFPGFSVREVPFGPRASAQVQVWTANHAFLRTPGAPWIRRAIEPLVRGGLQMTAGDPLGHFDQRTLEVEVGKVTLVRDIALGGDASASFLDDSWMLAAFRSLPNRVPTHHLLPHHALWGIEPNPVVRFLLKTGSLSGMAQQGRVPAPRPLVGYGNRLLARAHLQAALREGEQDLESLAGIFGRSLVDQVIGEGYKPERHALRSVASQQGLKRVALAPVLAGDVASPLRNTVSEQVIRVVHRHGGRHLLDVDKLVAETRFYPGRVFALGSERFEVPLHAFDAKRGEIQVEAVDESRSLTLPQLTLHLLDPTPSEAPLEIRSGKLVYTLTSFEVTSREQVSGVREASGRVTSYAPVQSQYRTRMRGVFFPAQLDDRLLLHLATSVEGVLMALLLAAPDDLAVVPLPAGQFSVYGPGFGVVDRHVQGIGAAEALDPIAVDEVFVWVRAVLSACGCQQGCAECTSSVALAAGPDKQGVLRLLGA